MYAACLDIQKCFDSIPHNRLKAVLEGLMLEEATAPFPSLDSSVCIGQGVGGSKKSVRLARGCRPVLVLAGARPTFSQVFWWDALR